MSKTRKRRMFGLTFTQLMILACLALAAIGAIFGSFILISSSTTPGGLALFPTSGQPSAAGTADLSAAPNEPGVGPTATLPIDPNEIPPDWVQYTATTIEISAPPQFESVNVADERQQRIATYRSQGYEFLAARLEDDTFDYRFWFNDLRSDNDTYDTHIVLKAGFLPTETLEEYVDEAYGAGLQGFQVADRQAFDIENLQAQRLQLDASLNGLPIRVADYVVTDGVNLWIISCGTTLEEFDPWLPVFDRVARSFHLLY